MFFLLLAVVVVVMVARWAWCDVSMLVLLNARESMRCIGHHEHDKYDLWLTKTSLHLTWKRDCIACVLSHFMWIRMQTVANAEIHFFFFYIYIHVLSHRSALVDVVACCCCVSCWPGILKHHRFMRAHVYLLSPVMWFVIGASKLLTDIIIGPSFARRQCFLFCFISFAPPK